MLGCQLPPDYSSEECRKYLDDLCAQVPLLCQPPLLKHPFVQARLALYLSVMAASGIDGGWLPFIAPRRPPRL